MPIEIKEMHIKVVVDPNRSAASPSPSDGDEKNEIIEACVEQVIEILSKKEER